MRRAQLYKFLTLFLLLSLWSTLKAFSQTAGSYTETRRLAWAPANEVDHYALTIERQGPHGVFLTYLSSNLKTTHYEAAFPPGSYRYQVTVYDIFGLASQPTPWSFFTVKPPLPPAQKAQPKPEPEKKISPFIFDITEIYAPLAPLYGAFNTFMNEKFFPIGFGLRLSAFYHFHPDMAAGIEAAPFWSDMISNPNGSKLSGGAFLISGNALFRCWFWDHRFSATVRAGLGTFCYYDLYFKKEDSSGGFQNQYWYLGIDTGLSLNWYVTRYFFATAGFDYIHVLTKDKPQSGYIRPCLGIGLEF